MLVAIAMHLGFALVLSLHDGADRALGETERFRSRLSWVERADPPPLPMPASAPASPSLVQATTVSVVRTISTTAAVPSPEGSAMSDSSAAPLILTVPSTLAPGTFDSHALDRSRSPPPYVETRFAKAWAPDGGAVQTAWAHRSRAAQLLLSATGALEFPCTEEEKRLRKQRCAGAQHDGAE